jgi:hypothetical protein
MMFKHAFLFILLLLACVNFSACTSQEEHPLIKSGRLQGYETLSPDEDALLRIRMALILKHLQRLDYPLLLDTWQLPELAQNPVYRTQFLNLMYCTDRFLGHLQSYEADRMVLLKEKDARRAEQTTYVVHVLTFREHAVGVEEQFHFVQKGLDYKWLGYFVKVHNKPAFYNCASRIR